MNETWRTPTVMAIVQTIRAEQRYDDLPILADAMEEADYVAEAESEILRDVRAQRLVKLRSPLDYVDSCRLLCEILGGEYAESVKWVEKHAADMGDSYESWDYDVEKDTPTQPMNYRVLMEAAKAYIDHGDYLTQYGHMNWQETFSSTRFWPHYEIITGVSVDDDKKGEWSFVGCSC